MLDIPTYDPHSPKIVKDLVGNTPQWDSLASQIRNNSCPHIVLCGPAGCGKSLFLRIVLEDRPLLIIDCTGNSGLRDLRDNLRSFSRGGRTSRGDYRWVVLEHADTLTSDTQAFLRRMMETTSGTTRFLFECQDAGAIAEPILSRSTLFTVSSPDETEVRYEIIRRTGLSMVDAEAIVALCGSNIRKALLVALATRWTKWNPTEECRKYRELLGTRPKEGSDAWMHWAVYAEKRCRNDGLDYRTLLQVGWPNNEHVSYMKSQWSRLGGISTKALFFRCMAAVHGLNRIP
jgi:hypothetical protein